MLELYNPAESCSSLSNVHSVNKPLECVCELSVIVPLLYNVLISEELNISVYILNSSISTFALPAEAVVCMFSQILKKSARVDVRVPLFATA